MLLILAISSLRPVPTVCPACGTHRVARPTQRWMAAVSPTRLLDPHVFADVDDHFPAPRSPASVQVVCFGRGPRALLDGMDLADLCRGRIDNPIGRLAVVALDGG